MPNINYVILGGYLGREPELWYTTSGKAVCNFSLAVSNYYKGQRKMSWFKITALEKLAEEIAEHLNKGDSVIISGRLCYDTWESASGNRSKVYITATEITPLEGKEIIHDIPEMPGQGEVASCGEAT